MQKKMLKELSLFTIGGGGYVTLELLYRQRSHWTMFVLGGLCFSLIGHLGHQRPRPPLPAQMVAGSGICTAGELLFGMIFNRGYTIWDYRDLPLNYHGQISLVFSLVWIPVSLLAAVLYGWLDRALPPGIQS